MKFYNESLIDELNNFLNENDLYSELEDLHSIDTMKEILKEAIEDDNLYLAYNILDVIKDESAELFYFEYGLSSDVHPIYDINDLFDTCGDQIESLGIEIPKKYAREVYDFDDFDIYLQKNLHNKNSLAGIYVIKGEFDMYARVPFEYDYENDIASIDWENAYNRTSSTQEARNNATLTLRDAIKETSMYHDIKQSRDER